ncbi:uncharacterized protein METZ01_LOCUS266659, partial [marine metagenome]
EGKYVGVPSVFLRTFGCNFRCMNFSLPRGTKKDKHNPEVKKLLDNGVHLTTKNFNDLPIIHTGCDTYASIYPEFKKFMMDKTIDEVVEHLLSLTPEGKWTMQNGQDIHLIFTGGEPLLGWQRLYIELLDHPKMKDLKNVTFETNTTQTLRKDFKEFLSTQNRFKITWSCSPKLSISGESWEDAINPNLAVDYASVNGSELYLKFVVADKVDVDEVGKAVKEYKNANLDCPVYLMPLGGRSEEYNFTYPEVAKLAMEKGWRFTPRLHISLFGNAWGT